jgi:hypothetical protein
MLCSCIHKKRKRQGRVASTKTPISEEDHDLCSFVQIPRRVFSIWRNRTRACLREHNCSSNLRVVVLIRPDEANLAIARGEAVLLLAGLAEDPVRPLPRRRVRAAAAAGVRWAGLVAVAGPAAAVRSAEVRPVSTAPVVRPLVAALVRDVDDVAVPAADAAVCRRGSAAVAVGRWRRLAVGGTGVGIGVRAAVVGRGVLAVPPGAVGRGVGVRAAVVGRRVLTVPASAVRRGIGVGASVVGRRVLAVPASAVRRGVGVRAAVAGRRVLAVPASTVRRGIGVGAAVGGAAAVVVVVAAVAMAVAVREVHGWQMDLSRIGEGNGA